MTFVHYQDVHSQLFKNALYGQYTTLEETLSTMDAGLLRELRGAVHTLDAAITTAMLSADLPVQPRAEGTP
jgi:hypothetical protein